MPQIEVDNLSKTFRVPEREGGFRAAVRSVFWRRFKDVRAVDHVSFTVAEGEIVGFLGPNGAGKTTTLKMLSDLLLVGLPVLREALHELEDAAWR